MNWFCNMFSFSGFMSRAPYWKCLILYVWLPTALLLPLAFLAGFYNPETNEVILILTDNLTFLQTLTWVLGIYSSLAFTWSTFALMAKRLRDFNVSPWFALLYIIIPFMVVLYGLFPTNVNSYER